MKDSLTITKEEFPIEVSSRSKKVTSWGSTGDGGPEDPLLGGEVDFDGRVTPRVVNLASENLLDRHLEVLTVTMESTKRVVKDPERV